MYRFRGSVARQWLKEAAALSDNTRWVVDQHLTHLVQLWRQVAVMEKRLRQVTAGDEVGPQLRREQQIGPITAAGLRVEIGQ